MSNSPLSSDAIRADEARRILNMLRDLEQVVLSTEESDWARNELAGYRVAVAVVAGCSTYADAAARRTSEATSVPTA